jgi:hypothetical protein
LAGFRDRFAQLTSLGVGLAALSVDTPERSSALTKQLGLPFPLLCDPARVVVEAWGLLNRNEKGGIAYPATFVIDTEARSRIVRLRSLDRMASRVDLDGLFSFLRSGLESAAPPAPKRAGILPRLGDFGRVTRNALRFGVRSPKG